MTITLASVYAPIGFMTGRTGKLFTEFAWALAGAVLVSGLRRAVAVADDVQQDAAPRRAHNVLYRVIEPASWA